MKTLSVQTSAREELLDITAQVQRAVAETGIAEGIAVIASAHTTAAITVNENADPDVPRDLLHWLRKLVPQSEEFRHAEGNSDAHLKVGLFGPSQTLIVSGGKVVLGTWQGIFLAEFDGPRARKVHVQVVRGG
jgi:secondary thiamine-phosphate synthase enzyme